MTVKLKGIRIHVPRPAFVLGDRVTQATQVVNQMRPLYGREDEDGKRQIVGYVDQYAPEFDEIMTPLLKKRGRRRRQA